MITSTDVVEQLLRVIDKACRPPTMAERASAQQRGTSRIQADAERLVEMLDAWRNETQWPPRSGRESAVERAKRDPTFHQLVQTLHGFMLQGFGHYTPTEVREAAMVAQMLLERDSCMPLHVNVPRPSPLPPVKPPPELQEGSE